MIRMMLTLLAILLMTTVARADTILVVIADDMDPAHIDRYPNSSPTLRKIQRQGTTYPLGWVPAKCAPSLATMLTGLHGRQHGRFYNSTTGDPAIVDVSSGWPRALQDAGWRGYLGGKWWYGDTGAAGFETRDPGATHADFARTGQDHLYAWLDGLDPGDDAFIWWAPLMPHTPHNAPPRS